MRRHARALIAVVVCLLILGVGQIAGAITPAAPAALPNTFTYQGRLMDGTDPADGSYSMNFRLYNAATGGQQVGDTDSQTVTVSEGLFTVQLDFGAGAFTGGPRWLQISVGGTDLQPRQPLTAAPYALYAPEAGSAPWSGLTGVPAGLSDGDDNTTYTAGSGLALNGTTFSADTSYVQRRVSSGCAAGSSISAIAADGTVTCEDDTDTDTTYTAGSGLALNGTEFYVQGSPLSNTLIVAKGGGDFISVQAALNSITDASAENPYLIYVASGVYTEQVTLKSHVAIEGAGEGKTILRWTGGSGSPFTGQTNSATVIGASNASLRHLTVQSVGSGVNFAVGMYSSGGTPALSHVTISASNGTSSSMGVYLANSPAAGVSHVTISANGSGQAFGILFNQSTATFKESTVTVAGGSLSFGIDSVTSTLDVSDVSVSITGGNTRYGVLAETTSIVTLTSSTITAGSATTSSGVFVSGTASVLVRDSAITGGVKSIDRVSGTAKVANSMLSGSLTTGTTCFDNYDANLAAVTCP